MNDAEFERWWAASKYCRFTAAGWRQAALDAWNAAVGRTPGAAVLTFAVALADFDKHTFPGGYDYETESMVFSEVRQALLQEHGR